MNEKDVLHCYECKECLESTPCFMQAILGDGDIVPPIACPFDPNSKKVKWKKVSTSCHS